MTIVEREGEREGVRKRERERERERERNTQDTPRHGLRAQVAFPNSK